MKKAILFATVFALSALMAAPAMARIKTSRHNLGITGDYVYRVSGAGTTQICMFCHTPHNPVKNVPLWNRSDPQSTAFKEYTGSPTMSDGNVTAGLSADSISLFCLSCHDGSNQLWARVQNRASEPSGTDDSITATRTNIGKGQDLTNDHPVNIRVSNARTGDTDNWKSDADITGSGGLRLFRLAGGSDYVECASCHDPHKTDYKRFLRKLNDSSSLCLTCHNK